MSEVVGTTSAESSTPPSPTPAPAPEKKTRVPGVWGLSKKQLKELVKAEQVTTAVQKPVYLPKLNGRGITSAAINQLITDIASARAKVAETVRGYTSRQEATQAEGNAERALLVALREVQAAAKQKHSCTNPTALNDYFVGRPLNGSQPRLAETAEAILTKAEDEDLPGITALKVSAMRQTLSDWKTAGSTQIGQESARHSDTHGRDDLIESIKTQRIQIQYAVDAEWPYSDPASAPIRTEFCLPPSRPFTAKPKNGVSVSQAPYDHPLDPMPVHD
jgi:hypothetical protein